MWNDFDAILPRSVLVSFKQIMSGLAYWMNRARVPFAAFAFTPFRFQDQIFTFPFGKSIRSAYPNWAGYAAFDTLWLPFGVFRNFKYKFSILGVPSAFFSDSSNSRSGASASSISAPSSASPVF